MVQTQIACPNMDTVTLRNAEARNAQNANFVRPRPARDCSWQVPRGLDSWLVAFLDDADRETAILRVNGADSQAAARDAVLKSFLEHASAYLDELIGIGEAAALLGGCAETARRKVRGGELADRRTNPTGHHRIRRGDAVQLGRGRRPQYDPTADAHGVATLRRNAA